MVSFFATVSKRRDSPSLGNPGLDTSIPLTFQQSSWGANQQFEAERERALDLLFSGELSRQLQRCNAALEFKKAEPLITQSMGALEKLHLFTDVFMSRSPVGIVEGHLIFTPHAVEPGDEICIVFGCNYPVIFRPEGEFHTVIGECYIYDLKDGEALNWLSQGKYQVKTFTVL